MINRNKITFSEQILDKKSQNPLQRYNKKMTYANLYAIFLIFLLNEVDL